MKRYTIQQIVKLLTSQGYEIQGKKRKDGGFRITSINGKKYTGSDGNKFVRALTGKHMSKKQIGQRKKNALAKSYKQLPQSLRKQVKEIRKMLVKRQNASLKFENIKKALKKRGLKQVRKELKSQERYARGFANYENVRWFIDRLETYGRQPTINYSYGDFIVALNKNIEWVKDKTLMDMYEYLYDAEHNIITPKQLENYLWHIYYMEIK